jgi:DNA polymerase III alpha subunit
MSKLVASGESEMRIREIYEMLQDIFGEKCYLEITAQDEGVLSITKKSNQFVYNLAKKTDTKLIVNNDYRYLRE